MRYLLNSAVLTAPGLYCYRLVSPEQARGWYAAGPAQSTIEYASTADLLSAILGEDVAVNYAPCTMRPGDEALVCRLAPGMRLERRLKSGDEGRRFALAQFRAGRFELGLLTCLES
jgi:hypothetical protein